MPSPTPAAKEPPLISPFSALLLAIFLLALAAAALSTQSFVKERDLPPPGVFLVVAGKESPLFVKLAQKSIKGLHRTNGIRGQLDAFGGAPARNLLVRDSTSTEWEKKIKIPQLTPGTKPADIESHIALILQVNIPVDPKLYGQTVPASFDLDMVVPRLDPNNPKVGQAAPDRVTWTMQLQIQPPGFQRLYQRINRIALIVAGAVLVVGLLRRFLRTRRKP